MNTKIIATLFLLLTISLSCHALEQCSEPNGECPQDCIDSNAECTTQDAGTQLVTVESYTCRKTKEAGCGLIGPNECPTKTTHDDDVDGPANCGIPLLTPLINLLPFIELETHNQCHTQYVTEPSENPFCKAGYKRIRQDNRTQEQPVLLQCCSLPDPEYLARSSRPTPTCQTISCPDVCENTTRKENGFCNPSTKQCDYETITENSLDCGYTPPSRLASIEVQPSTYIAYAGETIPFTYAAYSDANPPTALENVPVIWYTNESLGTIDENGFFTATALGQTIACAIHEASEFAGCSEITIIEAIQSTNLTLSPSPATALVNTSIPFTLTANGASAAYSLNPKWSWEGPSATLEPTTLDNTVAELTVYEAGEGIITATQETESGNQTISATVTIAETAGETTSIQIIPRPQTIPSPKIGDSLQLSIISADAQGTITNPTITWTASPPNAATIDETGRTTFLLSGTTTITATAGSSTDSVPFKVHECAENSVRQCENQVPGLFTTAPYPAAQKCIANQYSQCYLVNPCAGQTTCGPDGTCSNQTKCGPVYSTPLTCCPDSCNSNNDNDCKCNIGQTQRCTDPQGNWGMQNCTPEGRYSQCAADPLCTPENTAEFNAWLCAAAYSQPLWQTLSQIQSIAVMQTQFANCQQQTSTAPTPTPTPKPTATPTPTPTPTATPGATPRPECITDRQITLIKQAMPGPSFFNPVYSADANPAPETARYFQTPNYRITLEDIPRTGNTIMLRLNILSGTTPSIPTPLVTDASFTLLDGQHQTTLRSIDRENQTATITHRIQTC